jgi:hypothetical protein
MITKNDFIKAIEKNFNINLMSEMGVKIKKHSNICWQLTKEETFITAYAMLNAMHMKNNKNVETLPTKGTIFSYSFKHAILCKNANTGFNILSNINSTYAERVKTHMCEINKIKINNETYYIIWD